MSELTGNPVINTGEAKQDTGLDIKALLSESTPTSAVERPEEKPKSALDRAIEEQKNHQKGIIVNAEDEVVGPTVFKRNTDTKDSAEGFSEEITEQQELIEKTKLVYVVKRPADEKEYTEMTLEIQQVTQDPDGTVHVPEGAKYIVPKTEELVAKKEASEKLPETAMPEETPVEDDKARKEEEKNQLVKILIDKTGLGANIKFDEEEKKAIESSDMIHLVEVENKSLETVEIDRPDDGTPFLQLVDTYKLSVSKAPMTFPASGFKADMTGLSWGEFSDITLDQTEDSEDYINFDKLYKKLSTIYNNMKNISIGAFASFEDFLKHFAYTDVQFATYGLLIATQPEEDTITLMCNNKSCQKRFNWKYSPRSIINFDAANMVLLKQIDKINNAAPEERLKIAQESKVNKFTRFRLPNSGYLVDLGFASCYDYLYGILSLIKKYTEEEVPETDTRWELIGMLQGVRGIYLPKPNGKYLSATRPEDIVEVLKDAIPPSDIIILNSAYEHYINQYYIEFRLKGIQCPHCGTPTERLSITPDELVFLVHQRQRATPITFDNFQDF